VGVDENELLELARVWALSVHPHAWHIERTLDWLLVLEPEASVALQLAALLHDIERAFPPGEGEPPRPFSDDDYNDWHQDRSMRVAARWLAEQGAEPELLAEVSALVRVHEDGGWPDANVLQAADSLSFLEAQAELFAGFVEIGQITSAEAVTKFQWMHDRIGIPQAQALAGPLLDGSLARLSQARAA
jgi:Domain of unknown function (DUF4202)